MKNKKIWLLLALVVASGCLLLFKGSFAFEKPDASVENLVNTPTVKIITEEEFDKETAVEWNRTKDKKVKFTNTGTAPVFVRMSYSEYWKLGKQFLSNLVNEKELATKNWTASYTADWIDGKDGWYYYKHVLESNSSTDKILESVTFSPFKSDEEVYKTYQEAGYHLDFYVESLQVSKDNKVNEEATQEVFKKKGTVTDGEVSWS